MQELDLRDYFAAKAAGLAEDCSPAYAEAVTGVARPASADSKGWAEFWADADAKSKYMQADAMLKAREVP